MRALVANEAPFYSWEPVDAVLEALIGERPSSLGNSARASRFEMSPDVEPMPATREFDLLGMRANTFYRWRREPLGDARADLIATRLGLHPSLLWAEWYPNAELFVA